MSRHLRESIVTVIAFTGLTAACAKGDPEKELREKVAKELPMRAAAEQAEIAHGMPRRAPVPQSDAAGWTDSPARNNRVFEIALLDDVSDPLASVPDEKVPPGGEIRAEIVPIGPERAQRSHFAFFPTSPGDAPAAAMARAQRWVTAIPHPPSTFFVVGPLLADGVRTYLVREPAVVDDRDVAKVALEKAAEGPSIRLHLRPAGQERFALATREWTKRRIAILLDGVVNSAPVVHSAVTKGELFVQLGNEELAETLVRALSPKE